MRGMLQFPEWNEFILREVFHSGINPVNCCPCSPGRHSARLDFCCTEVQLWKLFFHFKRESHQTWQRNISVCCSFQHVYVCSSFPNHFIFSSFLWTNSEPVCVTFLSGVNGLDASSTQQPNSMVLPLCTPGTSPQNVSGVWLSFLVSSSNAMRTSTMQNLSTDCNWFCYLFFSHFKSELFPDYS